jgi:SagB-type dehydrogenase family enzyme
MNSQTEQVMKLTWSLVLVCLALFGREAVGQGTGKVKLPPPSHRGKISLEETLQQRRTVRRFAARPLELAQLSQLLWGTDGISNSRGYRTAPSAGATFPLELYLVVGERGVSQLGAGVYRYLPESHTLELVAGGDVRGQVAGASLHQSWMAEAPIMVVVAAEYRRCTARYGERGLRYTHMEVGHAGQNLFLQAEALGLGAGIVGAFDDRGLSKILKLPQEHEPLLVMPVGYKH